MDGAYRNISIVETRSIALPFLLTLEKALQFEQAKQAFKSIESAVEAMGRGLAGKVSKEGRLSRALLDKHQPEAFTLATCLADLASVDASLKYADRIAEDYEKSLATAYTAWVLKQISERLLFRTSAFGVDQSVLDGLYAQSDWAASVLSTEQLTALGEQLLAKDSRWSGAFGVGADHEDIRRVFEKMSNEKVAPIAEEIHRHDQIIPESLLQDYVEMGVFGISIPEEYGGFWIDNLAMCLTTEELSRGSLGAGGSVITRPEICAKALLKGGTEEQKQKWLPLIASGEKFVTVAVTEPNAGSDVASLNVRADKVEGGYLINGEKTWCTFAGRANLFILLARTGKVEDGHRGLSLFLVEKPAKISEDDHHHFAYKQDGGGTCEGRAIPTLGYRGMHSFSVNFEDFFVPAENLVGEEGKGFILQMEGFAGGRIQTAARAVGVMEAAFRTTLEFVKERKVFGQVLSDYALPQVRLVEMAARLMACRQLSYQVAGLMDEGKGVNEASLVKLLACKTAEWITREGMQLHGGMGYSEEYDISRYWVDARVLSIFEGAEEVLALYVVARQYLRQVIAGK